MGILAARIDNRPEVAFPIDMETLDFGDLVFVTLPGGLASDPGVHHRYAEGLRDVLQFVLGSQDISVISAYVDSTSLSDQSADALSRFEDADEVLVLSDVPQGSVNKMLRPHMNDHVHLDRGKGTVILAAARTVLQTPSCWHEPR